MGTLPRQALLCLCQRSTSTSSVLSLLHVQRTAWQTLLQILVVLLCRIRP